MYLATAASSQLLANVTDAIPMAITAILLILCESHSNLADMPIPLHLRLNLEHYSFKS